jgi:hypothetical protein
MIGVPRELAEHALKILPSSKPVRQAMRCLGDEKLHDIANEVSKLLKDGFVKEFIHTKWVANPVLSLRKTPKLCACVLITLAGTKRVPKIIFPCLALTKSLTRWRDRSFYDS